MKTTFSIRLKAALLLTVFALNTVIGFACAIGVNMAFNLHHHEEAEETEAVVHLHADGKKHVHQEEAQATHHEELANHKHSNEDGGCCNNTVIKFEQLDKSAAPNFSFVSPVFFTASIAVYYDTNILYSFKATQTAKYFVRSHHPPIPDIRIAIQSFQI